MLVTQKPLVVSEMGKGSFVFRRDSAGLGIPREELGDLRGFSRDTLRHGSASTPVYLTMDQGNDRMNRPSQPVGGEFAPVQMHRGFTPPMPPETGMPGRDDVGGMPSPSGPPASSPISSHAAAGGGAPRSGNSGGGTPH